jgi:catechol 2,3-dioxygenase-like lactoylglutathione lyase family enzyme
MAVTLDHLILSVNDIGSSIDFYTKLLGFDYEGDRDPFSIIRVNPDLILQLAPWQTSGGEHLASEMPRPEFGTVVDRVRAQGLEYGDSFHSVGNMRGPGTEHGARGPGDVVYFFDPSNT